MKQKEGCLQHSDLLTISGSRVPVAVSLYRNTPLVTCMEELDLEDLQAMGAWDAWDARIKAYHAITPSPSMPPQKPYPSKILVTGREFHTKRARFRHSLGQNLQAKNHTLPRKT